MTRNLKLFLCLATLPVAALAQTAEQPATTSSPVAYVYVSGPTHVNGFAVSSTGKLTPVPGSPFANIAVSYMSVNSKYVFGSSDDNAHIIGFSIASNGSLKKVSQINAHDYPPDGFACFDVGPTRIDVTGTRLYNDDWNCDGNQVYIQSYRIEANGSLQFLANSGGTGADVFLSRPPAVLGNNKYAYHAGIAIEGNPGLLVYGYKRESNGALVLANTVITPPTPKNPDDVYSPESVLASDRTNHLAFALHAVNRNSGAVDGPLKLASFTADAQGNLTTTNTFSNMALVGLVRVLATSISPSAKLLAIGAGRENAGFQLFHFNGASPITHYTGKLQPGYKFIQLGWDRSNHLYALSTDKLFVYTVTPTSVTQAPGSPYSIPKASSVIVSSLQ